MKRFRDWEVKEVFCERWFLSKRFKAITLFPFIFYYRQPSYAICKHEYVHVEQIRKQGVLKFYLLYLYYTVKYGYWKNPFEVEAYAKQREYTFSKT